MRVEVPQWVYEKWKDPKHTLNLYLVDRDLRPAATRPLTPFDFSEKYKEVKEGDGGVMLGLGPDFDLRPEDIERFREALEGLNLEYQYSDKRNARLLRSNEELLKVPMVRIRFGKDKESLERLLNARTDEEFGKALGYPEEDIENFGRNSWEDVKVALAKAKKAGKDLPTWLAYISHIPHKLDIVNGEVSEGSRKLGRTFQRFVRKNHPGLAGKVEEYFLNQQLPESWEKKPSGYELEY